MPSPLHEAIAARFVFVVGKGGVGKTTAAAALGLGAAEAGRSVSLISTDPAHSVADFFGLPPAEAHRGVCGAALHVEELDARAYAQRWTTRVAPELAALVEAGTYLDAEDAGQFLAGSLPGIDEIMAALRLGELAAEDSDLVVVDTAPTGHTLRLLDSDALMRSWLQALHAMAAKAGAVSAAFGGGRVSVAGERLIADFEASAERWRADVLGRAEAVVITRADAVVAAETERLLDALEALGVRCAAIVENGAGAAARGTAAGVVPHFAVPMLAPPAGCAGARDWLHAVRPAGASLAAGAAAAPDAPVGAAQAGAAGESTDAAAAPWLDALELELIFFAGKGGVGKTTCAAAAALRLSTTRPVLLYGTDPAGSLGNVLAAPVGAQPVEIRHGLNVQQIDAEAMFVELRREYEEQIGAVFDRLGLGGGGALDRQVALSLWNMAPPGIDEVAALIGMLDAATDAATVVVDTAPTGHFLRLLEMPALALDWIHALMRVLLKYRAAGELDVLAERLLELARQLKRLQVTLTTPGRSGVVVVGLDEPVVHAETERLLAALRRARVPVAAWLLNRRPARLPAPPALAADARAIAAPALVEPPVGVSGLEAFVEGWRMIA